MRIVKMAGLAPIALFIMDGEAERHVRRGAFVTVLTRIRIQSLGSPSVTTGIHGL